MAQEALLTIKQAAKTLGVHETTVRRWIRNGALEAIILPTRRESKRKSIRITQATIDKILEPKLVGAS